MYVLHVHMNNDVEKRSLQIFIIYHNVNKSTSIKSTISYPKFFLLNMHNDISPFNQIIKRFISLDAGLRV